MIKIRISSPAGSHAHPGFNARRCDQDWKYPGLDSQPVDQSVLRWLIQPGAYEGHLAFAIWVDGDGRLVVQPAVRWPIGSYDLSASRINDFQSFSPNFAGSAPGQACHRHRLVQGVILFNLHASGLGQGSWLAQREKSIVLVFHPGAQG